MLNQERKKNEDLWRIKRGEIAQKMKKGGNKSSEKRKILTGEWSFVQLLTVAHYKYLYQSLISFPYALLNWF